MSTITAFKSNFPENLRFLRKRLGLSQEELAEKVGLNRGNIASYEKGGVEPNLSTLRTMASFFEISIDMLLEDNLESFDFENKDIRQWTKLEKEQEEIYFKVAKQAEDLKAVIEGFSNYHRFKMQRLDTLPKDLQMISINFEELLEVTQVLLNNHLNLVKLIQVKPQKKVESI
jgi:transcriptional regulator with XRE-family HTH domain